MLVITRPGACFVQAIHESEVCRTALRLLRPNNAQHRCWSDRKRYWLEATNKGNIYIWLVQWFGTFFIFPTSWDDDPINPIWLSYFQIGWNHEPVYIYIVWIFHSKIILSLDLKVSSPVLGTWELLPDFSGIPREYSKSTKNIQT